ncbi:MAG: YqgE/AlgH family protein [Tepidisphaeraceae bacterium]
MPQRRGQFLIASSQLLDPNFVKTVVLVVNQDDSGVVGLVLNRPLEVTVADSCGPEVPAAAGVTQVLRRGGPCAGPLMVLHRRQDVLEGDPGQEIVAGVQFTTDRESIESLMRHGAESAMLFAGYAGWSVEQLENEIDEGAWIVSPGNCEEVFAADEQLWQKLTTRLILGKWISPERIPQNPSLN